MPERGAHGNQMIYVLCGSNEVAVRENVEALRRRVEPADLRDANITALDGAVATPDGLLAAAMTVPFLTNFRLVIVRGLISRFDGRRASTPVAWRGIGARLAGHPETTVLAFADGALSQSGGPLMKELRDGAGAQVRRNEAPKGAELRRWIVERVSGRGAEITERAAATLGAGTGSDMIGLDSEIEKLSIFAGDRPISHEDVESMVTSSREVSIFAAVDSVLEGRTDGALAQIRRILADGNSVGYVMYMLHRQVRLLLLAKDLQASRVASKDMSGRLGLSGYPMRKVLEQSSRYTLEHLAAAHGLLAQFDERIKSGGVDEEVALDVLVADLGALARTA